MSLIKIIFISYTTKKMQNTKKLEFIDLYADPLDDTAKDDLCMDDEEWQKYLE
jgi:hypothetical protein